jgi:ribonucleoside-diphosphate reductase alpha chain
MISVVLRLNSGVDAKSRVAEIIDQLADIGGTRSVGFGPDRVKSLPDAVARALKRHLADSTLQAGAVMAAHNPDPTPAPADKDLEEKLKAKSTDICPSCGAAALVFEEGCAKCYSCGHTEC